MDCPRLAFNARRPPMRTVISRAVRVNRLARSSSRVSGDSFSGPEVVAELVGTRFEHGERADVGLLLRGVGAPA